MKNVFIPLASFLMLLVMVLPAGDLQAKDDGDNPGESTFKVLGMCGMCKDRIERAAYGVRGVRFASWDQEEQKVTVRFRPNRTSQEEIERAIARVGHDTENFLTDQETYANLHHCCVYPRDPEMLKNNKVHNEKKED